MRPSARIVLPMDGVLCMFRQLCEPNRGREPAQTAQTAMAKHSSDFLNVLDERGFIHQCSDFAGLDALAAKGEVVAYVGYDCTAPSLHVGHLISIMMLHWLQQTGRQADRADGRRHDARRRSLRQGRDAAHPADRDDRGQQGRHQGRVRALPDVRQRPHRRHHGRQRRMAGAAQLHRVPARRRPALLRQPHADHGLGASCGSSASRSCRSSSSTTCCCRPTTSSSWRGATAAICRWAAPTSGATSSPASISAGAWARSSSTR